MSNVEPIFGGPSSISRRDDVLEVLRETLGKAERGEVSDIAIVYLDPVEVSHTSYVGRATLLLGATVYLQRDLSQ